MSESKNFATRRHVAHAWMIFAALWLAVSSAHAISGTDRVAWNGRAVQDVTGWPEGAMNLVNDPLRTDGWKPWFSGHPSDVNFYEYRIRDMADVNRLLRSLAAIKTTNLTLRLRAEKQATGLGFSTVLSETNATAVIFSLGNQHQLNELARQLSEATGIRGSLSRYTNAPTASPPALTLYAGHEAVDLKQLRIPDGVQVISDVRAGEKNSAAAVKAIEAFMANGKSKSAKSAAAQSGANDEHMAWVENCLKDFEAIKPGMTRGEVEKKFNLDGGLQGASPVRYVHPSAPHFKVDVEFDFKRNAADQGRAITGKDDKVIRVSKPYLERPFAD